METLLFEVDEATLYGTLHLPEIEPRASVLICAPLLEERKCANRTLVELADQLAAKGLSAMRFDYRGTGDSQGNHRELTVESCIADILTAMTRLRENTSQPIFLFGLRLGATLAALAASRAGNVDGLLLWQPVVSGNEFFQLNFRRSTFRQSLIRKTPESKKYENRAAADLDGFLVSYEFCDETRAIDLTSLDKPAEHVLIAQLSFKTASSKELDSLAEKWHAEFEKSVCQPFWNRIGYVDCRGIVASSVDWILSQLMS